MSHSRKKQAGPATRGANDQPQMDPGKPHTFPQRKLLIATGMSPQVVTETVFALAVQQKPAFVPTEIHLISTTEGAERARLELLTPGNNWFGRLCDEYRLSSISFSEHNIHVVSGGKSRLDDIRTEKDNNLAADFITETVRRLTSDPSCAVHASISGGRKTMGFYLGYALSLYGRDQDRLSHVLVSEPYETNRNFYFPTANEKIRFIQDGSNRTRDAHQAAITLAYIPFVPLRHGLPDGLLHGRTNYTGTVHALQTSFAPPSLTIDIENSRLICGGTQIKLAPALFIFYAWLANRRRLLAGEAHRVRPAEQNKSAYANRRRPLAGEPHRVRPAEQNKSEYMEFCERYATSQTLDNARRALVGNMRNKFLWEKVSLINTSLKKSLGKNVDAYLVQSTGAKGSKSYGLSLDASHINIQGL